MLPREEIDVTEEEVLICQKYTFEIEGYKILIAQMTSESIWKIDNEKYKILLNEYIDTHTRFKIVWNEIVNKYLKEHEKNLKYTLIFEKQKLILQ